MDHIERKVIELTQKLESLAGEFQVWRDLSEEGKSLEKNYTQIRRILGVLNGYRQQIQGQLKASPQAQTLAECRKIERHILEIHRIWQFFRSKLILRTFERFRRYLLAADEFAWACYEAAQKKAPESHVHAAAVKEPPLIFFNGISSPFASSRARAFEAEPNGGAIVNTETFTQLVSALPVSVIGVPWFQIQHLPDALVIGHEVGHNVEDDFRLTDRLRTLLEAGLKTKGISDGHRDAWHQWRGEVFADIYGTLATGPAFVGSLIDFLQADPARIAADRRTAADWTTYPTDYLRVLLTIEVLSQRGFGKICDNLKEAVVAAFGPHHAMTDFEPEISVVVRSLVDGVYPELGDAKLSEVLSFSKEDHAVADKAAQLLVQGNKPVLTNVRHLFATAALAYQRNPAQYVAKKAHDLVLDNVPIPLGTRGEKTTQAGPEEIKCRQAAEETYDGALGAQMFQRITRLHEKPRAI